MEVDVLNLATGHHLPAGFAFAREMWTEVAVSPSSSGDDFLVIAGGKDLRELRKDELLEKFKEGEKGLIKNFQGVLWNGKQGEEIVKANGEVERVGETVLQNETVKVLFGKVANENGFPDRVNFLLPGEIRRLKLKVDSRAFGPRTKRVRVRILFRNYPPEFLKQLSDRYLEFNTPEDNERAQRCLNLIDGLRIHEMARDTFTLN